MVEIGIRELRADLSKLLKRVQDGEEILVTDRGKAIAKVTPADGMTAWDKLVASGYISPAPNRGPRFVPKPVEGAGPLSDLVIEGRG